MPNQAALESGPLRVSTDAVISALLDVFELVSVPEPSASNGDAANEAASASPTLLVAAHASPSTPIGEVCGVRLGGHGHGANATVSASKSTTTSSAGGVAEVLAGPALLVVVRSAQCPTVVDTLLIETSELSSLPAIKSKLEQWTPRGLPLPRSRRPAVQPPAHPPPTVAQHNHHLQMHHPSPSFGIPLNFAQSGGGNPSSTTAPPYRYGQSDLVPAGGDGGFSRVGGQPENHNAPGVGGGGGMIFGASNPVFNGGVPTSSTGVVDPTYGLARFDPFFPQAGPGPGLRPPHAAFAGEPDPDHLRPWNNDGQLPGGMLPGNRGRRGGGGGFPGW